MSVKTLKSAMLEACARADDLSGQHVSLCKQCGSCTAACPNIEEMDLSPREMMHLAQLGSLEEILESQSIWVCSSCLQCSARCPRGIDIARVMEALRAMRLRARLGRMSPAEALDPVCADAPPILLISAMRKLTG